MHRHTDLLASLLLAGLLLLGGCATPYDIGNADARVTPTEAAKNVPGMLNHTVAWGGLIAVIKNLQDKTEIEVVASACQGNLTKMAEMLGIGRTTLWRKIKASNIRVEDFRRPVGARK